MSHSKRNTSRAVFTSHEREQAKKAWGASSARLSRDSMLPFSACRLCLETAEEPVACVHGDVFCRECALSNILAQKKEIKRLDKVREQEAREKEEAEQRRDAEAREREVSDFERTLSGVGSSVAHSHGTAAVSSKSPDDTPPKNGAARPGKRKFEMNDEELQRIAAQQRAKARQALDHEKAAMPKLPSFWTPSITPSSNTTTALHDVVKKAKTAPTCPASQEGQPHAYSLATLVTVHFTEEIDEKTKKKQRLCPSCKKVLSNASKAMLAKPCGHVMCLNCVDKFMRPSKHGDPHADDVDFTGMRCYVCEANLIDSSAQEKSKKKDKERIRPGLVELRSEGTGFSAGGSNQVQKVGVAFQC
ncbi:hypothetical protein PFICI_13007 [Pestalotiopsis fici W106-1]|uniref:RING-type domain-containing protein n=1 Tax=Pestalotiopsis fici (strain W106-1 / CGMCC3.15140) TaxID=1229662 RepID=W3WQD2_PESFW|nr:uncharacterized protein PFICI_13007 [Pestalotiopsis fici W106-1]ETS76063.1 hypothetical protein PFICI_13007 [Pestalotiopsis fici W106-1]